MHGILKLRAAILADPTRAGATRYGGRGTEEVVADLEREPHATTTSARRPQACPAAAGGTVPDATGLELIAQELREAHARRGARHRFIP